MWKRVIALPLFGVLAVRDGKSIFSSCIARRRSINLARIHEHKLDYSRSGRHSFIRISNIQEKHFKVRVLEKSNTVVPSK